MVTSTSLPGVTSKPLPFIKPQPPKQQPLPTSNINNPTPSASETKKPRTGGGGGGGSSPAPKAPAPAPTQETVIINNQGYSVAPELQKQFIEQKTQQTQRRSGSVTSQIEQNRISIDNKNIDRGKVPSKTNSLMPQAQNYNVKTQPYIEERQIGSFKAPGYSNKDVPITQKYYVDPTGIGMQKERVATQEDLSGMQRELQASTEKDTYYNKASRKASGVYSYVDETIKERVTYPIIGSAEKVIGSYDTRTESLNKLGETKFAKYTPLGIASSNLLGMGSGIIEDVKQSPAKNIVIFGLSAGISGGISAGGKLATSLAAKTGTRIIPEITTVGIRTAEVGAGTYLAAEYGISTYKTISSAQSPAEKSSAFGVAAKDITLAGFGFAYGSKLTTQGIGFISTIGKTERPLTEVSVKDVIYDKKQFVESGSYGYKGGFGPEKRQFDLDVFKQKGYMYHATPRKFWGDSIKITKGGSEFEGLYGAPDASLYFLKTGGGSYKLIPSASDLFKDFGSPGVAKIYSEFGYSGIKKIGPGKFEFTGELKPGVAYTTGIKPEIEAVLPYDVTKKAEYIGSKEYFKFKGQRITIDEFKASYEGSSKNSELGPSPKTKSYGDYSYKTLYNYPVYTPSAFISLASLAKYSYAKSNTFDYYPLTSYKKDSINSYQKSNMQNYPTSYKSKLMNFNNQYSLNPYNSKETYFSKQQYNYIPSNLRENIITKPGKNQFDIQIGIDGSSISKAPRPSRKYRYTASLSAAVLGIKGRPRAFSSDRFGKIYGGGIRPIPTLTKSRKKRKHKY